MTGESVSKVLDAIQAIDQSRLSADERHQLRLASQELLGKAESPWDTLTRLVWVNPAQQASLRTLVDLKLFEKWVANGGGTKTAKQLGEMVGCDPALMERLMRMLASTNLALNPSPYEYAMNDFTASLADRNQHSAIRFWYESNIPASKSLPQFLANYDYRNPGGALKSTAFNWANDHVGTPFDYLADRPSKLEDFNFTMKGYSNNLTPWTEIYPTEKLVSGAGNDEVIVVDIGGNIGHDLKKFAEKHDVAPKRLLVQDQADMVARAETDGRISTMAHDFFKPQPVKGARAYYLHTVLHDWPDDKARDILRNLKPAVTKGQSKVLLHEVVLFPQGNVAEAAQADITMMAMLNACERSLDAWKALVEPEGYTISNVYKVSTSPQAVLELDVVA